MAFYAAVHPDESLQYETPAQVASANSGDVLWPVLVAVFALVAAVAILQQTGRLSYVASGAANVLMVGFALTMPSWLVALDPLAVLLAIMSVAGLVASAAGWVISIPLPEAQPRWPTHHELG
jgi:Na+/proline symporter